MLSEADLLAVLTVLEDQFRAEAKLRGDNQAWILAARAEERAFGVFEARVAITKAIRAQQRYDASTVTASVEANRKHTENALERCAS